ncbi:hypothetical protein A3709_20365 [Halioglobus sp. HI00S01]|uniref:hypothetical protein n=1 Tax=Halioglobus sp. HI00S01 TaxID=1822214 RepID=UPI0007C2053F|nr:hypothetical protein [Halioglobus sp. HI00S01]KZX57968.1 hypothetical protein A3709_20365 [Halioglobus sp. HI00S01]
MANALSQPLTPWSADHRHQLDRDARSIFILLPRSAVALANVVGSFHPDSGIDLSEAFRDGRGVLAKGRLELDEGVEVSYELTLCDAASDNAFKLELTIFDPAVDGDAGELHRGVVTLDSPITISLFGDGWTIALIEEPITEDEYGQRQGSVCPVCTSDQIEGGRIEVDGGGAWQPIACNHCGSTWDDDFKLTGYSRLSISREDAAND